jgi:hypothetical protein
LASQRLQRFHGIRDQLRFEDDLFDPQIHFVLGQTPLLSA